MNPRVTEKDAYNQIIKGSENGIDHTEQYINYADDTNSVAPPYRTVKEHIPVASPSFRVKATSLWKDHAVVIIYGVATAIVLGVLLPIMMNINRDLGSLEAKVDSNNGQLDSINRSLDGYHAYFFDMNTDLQIIKSHIKGLEDRVQ